ncbi:hypothetical protein CEW46_24700, partial [Bacillus cereus]
MLLEVGATIATISGVKLGYDLFKSKDSKDLKRFKKVVLDAIKRSGLSYKNQLNKNRTIIEYPVLLSASTESYGYKFRY